MSSEPQPTPQAQGTNVPFGQLPANFAATMQVPVSAENQMELVQLLRNRELENARVPSPATPVRPASFLLRCRRNSDPIPLSMPSTPGSPITHPRRETRSPMRALQSSPAAASLSPRAPSLVRMRSQPTPSRLERPSDRGVSEENLQKWVAHETATCRSEILSRLYNYMKISEMDRYGIPVFERILETYLPVLDDSDVSTLVTSYWCNGMHFQCIVKYRGTVLKDGVSLRLEVNDQLLDAAITGGSTVDKIRCMLKQRRSDLGDTRLARRKERDFFVRNCQYRLWNHEVLVKAFLENGWLARPLAQVALDRFCSHIYDRAMSGCSSVKLNPPLGQELFLGNDDTSDVVPSSSSAATPAHTASRGTDRDEDALEERRAPVSAKIIRRWRALIEILTSRGARCAEHRFRLPSLHRALVAGSNTWRFVSSEPEHKNHLLMDACGLRMPAELWAIVSGHL